MMPERLPFTITLSCVAGLITVSAGCVYLGLVGTVIITATGGVEETCKSTVVTESIDGCVFAQTACCAVEVCGLETAPGVSLKVECGAVAIAEWDDTISLLSSTWSTPGGLTSGDILVDPATEFALPLGVGPLVTDPGYSAWVLRLDVENLDPTEIEVVFEFEVGGSPNPCIKWLQIVAIGPEIPGTAPSYIAPTEGLGLDFTALQEPDPHVVCGEGPVPVGGVSWGSVKVEFR